MRKVKVFKYDRAKGENHYSKVDDGTATFHEWGSDFLEGDFGTFSNFSTAIIERDDGSVENVPADLVQFIKPEDGL